MDWNHFRDNFIEWKHALYLRYESFIISKDSVEMISWDKIFKLMKIK